MMKFIFSTGSLYTYSIDRVFGFAKKAGYDGMELLMDDRWDTRQADFISSLIKKHNREGTRKSKRQGRH